MSDGGKHADICAGKVPLGKLYYRFGYTSRWLIFSCLRGKKRIRRRQVAVDGATGTRSKTKTVRV